MSYLLSLIKKMESLENKIDEFSKAFYGIEKDLEDGMITSNEYYNRKSDLIQKEKWKYAIRGNNIIKELAEKHDSSVVVEYCTLENKVFDDWLNGTFSMADENRLMSIRNDGVYYIKKIGDNIIGVGEYPGQKNIKRYIEYYKKQNIELVILLSDDTVVSNENQNNIFNNSGIDFVQIPLPAAKNFELKTFSDNIQKVFDRLSNYDKILVQYHNNLDQALLFIIGLFLKNGWSVIDILSVLRFHLAGLWHENIENEDNIRLLNSYASTVSDINS